MNTIGVRKAGNLRAEVVMWGSEDGGLGKGRAKFERRKKATARHQGSERHPNGPADRQNAQDVQTNNRTAGRETAARTKAVFLRLAPLLPSPSAAPAPHSSDLSHTQQPRS